MKPVVILFNFFSQKLVKYLKNTVRICWMTLECYMYKLNNISYDHSEIGERIGKQRNMAHGNLDKEFINESLLDVVFLEEIVLAITQYFWNR